MAPGVKEISARLLSWWATQWLGKAGKPLLCLHGGGGLHLRGAYRGPGWANNGQGRQLRLTETRVETPFLGIVTPKRLSAISIDRLL